MTLDRRLALPAVEAGLELLGGPLTPYQIDAAAAISAPGPEPGTYTNLTVVILWPRQTGKTTLLATLALGRARRELDYRAAYAAQTGHITSGRFKEWSGQIHRRPGWRHDYNTRDSDGTERITVRATGSYLRAFPPIPGRLRSTALDLVIVDEAQEHDDAKIGERLDASIIPTMDTRPRAQRIIAGTAGDLSSTYFRRHYRRAVDNEPGTLLLELGTWPADADPDDPATWQAHHPGLRAGRTTLAKLAQARTELGAEVFAREYGNRWSEAAQESIFPPGAWAACHRRGAGITGPVSLALEMPPAREHAYLLAAGPSTRPGAVHTELVAQLPLAQAVTAAATLTAEHRTPLWVDPQSPAVTFIDALRRARIPLHLVTPADAMTASLAHYDRVRAGTLTHLDQPPLTTAAAAAGRRVFGTRWAYDRNAPNGALLMGTALAVLAAERRAGHDTAPTLLHA